MTPVDVEHICESIFKDTAYGVVIWKVVVLPKVSAFIEVDGSIVGGEDM